MGEAFETQAERTPIRTLPMLGMAYAEKSRGNHVSAAPVREQLASIWINADADIKAKLHPEPAGEE